MSRLKEALRGQFITFEGIDGCGKSTQARRLGARLRAGGAVVVATREPGGTAIGRAVRAVLLNAGNAAMDARCELLLYLADRVQHLGEVIRPALARGETVVCDRYHDATVAYQGHARGLDLAPLEGFIAAEVLTTRPHVTLWLDVPVAEGQRRIGHRNDHAAGAGPDESRLDAASAAFHERVRAGYEALWRAEPERIVRIDAAGDEDAVAAAIWDALEERYGLRDDP